MGVAAEVGSGVGARATGTEVGRGRGVEVGCGVLVGTGVSLATAYATLGDRPPAPGVLRTNFTGLSCPPACALDGLKICKPATVELTVVTAVTGKAMRMMYMASAPSTRMRI